MAKRFMQTVLTTSVLAAQQHYYGRSATPGQDAPRDAFTEDEAAFIQARDSFYMATVTETGWPYVQHRGGEPGFLRVVTPSRLAFADYRGNRQLISTGNLAASDKVCLFLMDYPAQTRLKILGHARTEDAREHPDLVEQFAGAEARQLVERVILIDVLSFDWNCQKYITPRYTAAEVDEVTAVLRHRVAELEAQLAAQPEP